METTQIFGTNQPQIVENAVDRSLETLSLRAEKDKDLSTAVVIITSPIPTSGRTIIFVLSPIIRGLGRGYLKLV